MERLFESGANNKYLFFISLTNINVSSIKRPSFPISARITFLLSIWERFDNPPFFF